MFLAAIGLVGMNTDSRLDIGFIEQIQQRLAIMAIGRGGFNRQHQPVAIDHRMLLIAKYRLAAFSNPACFAIHTGLGHFNNLRRCLRVRFIVPFFSVTHHLIRRPGSRFTRTLRNARINMAALPDQYIVRLYLRIHLRYRSGN